MAIEVDKVSVQPAAPVTVRPNEVADVLDRAADAIEAYGWVQGMIGGVGYGFCAYGAIGHAARYNWGIVRDASRVLLDVLNAPVNISEWNDMPGRTAEHVRDALRAAAKNARSLDGRA